LYPYIIKTCIPHRGVDVGLVSLIASNLLIPKTSNILEQSPPLFLPRRAKYQSSYLHLPILIIPRRSISH
jgi:hypothetical protein